MATVPRNALGAAWKVAFQTLHSAEYDPDIAEAVNALEILSRREPISVTPSMQQEMHDLFQRTAPALDEAEHLFNAALAGNAMLHQPRGGNAHA